MNIYRIKADGKGINAIKPSNHGKGTCLRLGGTGKGRSVGDLLLFIFSSVCVKVHLPEKNGHWLEKKITNISLHSLPVVLHHGHHL